MAWPHQVVMCFLPNSRASIDHAPGPIIASVPPSTARMIDINVLPLPAKAIQSSTAAISAPATGVQNPANMNIPKTAPAACEAMSVVAEVPLNITMARQIRAVPVMNRCRNRPKPGHPLANVENSRCKQTSFGRLRYLHQDENSRKSETTLLLLGD